MNKSWVEDYRYQIASVALIVVAAVVMLNWQGRVWWCQAGDYTPWAWNIWSAHNSQHVLDPYTFTHVLHGVLEFWLMSLILWKVPMAWRFVLAIFIESSWEVAENTSYVINRYREETISRVLAGLQAAICKIAGTIRGHRGGPSFLDTRQSDREPDHAHLSARSDKDLANGRTIAAGSELFLATSGFDLCFKFDS